MTDKHIRFCQNNLLQLSGVIGTPSSAAVGFPYANAIDSYRYRAWRTNGAFEITVNNRNLYINDGSNKTAVLTTATYTSGALLAAQIQTQLNAVSTNWTCIYQATGLFTIARSASPATLRVTVTTDSIWDTIGFTGGVDLSANPSSVSSNVRRNHTSEKLFIDLQAALEVRAFHAIAGASELFSISETAVVTLKANNIPFFSSAPLSVTITPERDGIFKYLETEDIANTTYRYWQFEFQDRENPNGPQFAINQLYLGTYVAPVLRNINLGLQREIVDESRAFTSEGGVRYFRRLPRYWRYSSTSIEFVIDEERVELERVFAELGQTTSLFISYDPGAAVSDSVGEFTKYMDIENASVQHQRYKYFTIDFAAREVI
jgi:hypothetical protein